VSGDRPQSVIGKEAIRLMRIRECGEQSERKILKNCIYMPIANRTPQLLYTRGFTLVRDRIKRGLGNAEIDDVKRPSNVRLPRMPHVIDVNGARRKRARRVVPRIAPHVKIFKATHMHTNCVGIDFGLRLCQPMARALPRDLQNPRYVTDVGFHNNFSGNIDAVSWSMSQHNHQLAARTQPRIAIDEPK
jgi:hypothetical protein